MGLYYFLDHEDEFQMKNSLTRALLERCEDVSEVMNSLSHPVRLKILCHLMEEEKSVNSLTEFCEISQSSMSQFLGRMKSEGVLESRREGTSIYYRVADLKMIKLLRAIKEIYCNP